MKSVTLLVEMRCNNFCVYCGARAIDPAMIEKRKSLGLSIPREPLPVNYLLRKAADRVSRLVRNEPEAAYPMVRGSGFEAFTLESAVDTLKRARRDGYEGLALQGGEPTIWPPLAELIEQATELGFKEITLVTNGRRLADRAYSERLIRAGLTSIVVSLLGQNAEVHDGVSLVPGSFDALIRGLRTCVEIRSNIRPNLHISSNVITSRETYRALAAQVEMLSDLGVDAATVHLVRFMMFGDDPIVRERLAFPIEAIRGPLRDAMEMAMRKGFKLHADDIPLCMHPGLEPSNVKSVLQRSEFERRHHQGPIMTFRTGGKPRRRMPSACDGCLFRENCPVVADEYLARDVSRVVRAVTPERIAAMFQAQPDGALSRERVEQGVASLVIMREQNALDENAFGNLMGHAQRAFARLVQDAMESGQEAEAIRSLHGLLGLRAPLHYKPVGRIAAARQLGQFAEISGRHIRFVDGFELVIEGTSRDNAETTVTRAVPIVTSPQALGGATVHALFQAHFFDTFRTVKAVRCTDRGLEINRGQTWQMFLQRSVPHSLQWLPIYSRRTG